MRQIKFRAWLDGEMYPDVSTWTDDYTDMLNETLKHFQERDDEKMVLMQYTGLKDKNGKEIYEGDIVKSLFPYNDKFLENIDPVIWHTEKCGFNLGPRYFHDELILEVIGNIYENPELLQDPISSNER